MHKRNRQGERTMVKAFFLGAYEFRQCFTTSFVGEQNEHLKYKWYDRGRDLSHWLTLRRYEEV